MKLTTEPLGIVTDAALTAGDGARWSGWRRATRPASASPRTRAPSTGSPNRCRPTGETVEDDGSGAGEEVAASGRAVPHGDGAGVPVGVGADQRVRLAAVVDDNRVDVRRAASRDLAVLARHDVDAAQRELTDVEAHAVDDGVLHRRLRALAGHAAGGGEGDKENAGDGQRLRAHRRAEPSHASFTPSAGQLLCKVCASDTTGRSVDSLLTAVQVRRGWPVRGRRGSGRARAAAAGRGCAARRRPGRRCRRRRR